jgi:Xaa-Pro dipeptidase
VATQGSTDTVSVGQTYAWWNPSITGAKSEDTVLVGEDGNEVLTTIPDWPMLSVAVEGQTEPMPRPAILEIS